MKVKVCGMRDPQNIAEATSLPIDFMGFIFWDGSSRFVQHPTPKLPNSITKVGVFVNASLTEILATARQHQLGAIQLHGQESVELCQQLQAAGTLVIKAFSVGKTFDFSQLRPYESHCDYFLFDTKSDLPGGSGKQFDWTLLNEYDSPTPFWIAGGIGPKDVETVLQLKKKGLPLHTLDLNSKFETAPAQKNIELLAEFLNQIQS